MIPAMKAIFSIILLCCAVTVFAHNGNLCSASKGKKAMAKTTWAAVEEGYYDIKHVRFNISLTNTSTAVSGDLSTTATILVSNFDVYAFELDPVITIDSFKMNGQLIPLTSIQTNGSVRKVNLPAILPINTSFTAQVFYHGQPPNGSGFFTNGLNHVTLPSGTQIMYTLSDMYTAEDWWPSKQVITDKIDSADIWVTVDDTLKAGSNGLLTAVTPMPGNKARYEWKTRYPIDYYLISVAVAPYGDYSYYMHYTDGSGDSMLIQNYVYDSAAYMTPARKAALDSTGIIVDHFSKLFGKYPFHEEKYGHCIAEPLGGGMEHQTMTTLAYATTTLIAHELGHQWWGDNVTYGSWADIWLSEGFATYCEQLFIEKFRTPGELLSYRTGVFNQVMSGAGSSGGSVYVNDTNNVSRVFNSRLTYRKGASVAHMLRYMAPVDSLYFKALRQYQQQYKYGLAKTPDLQAITEQAYGIDLDTFFDQWIYKEGYPTYSVKWDQVGSTVYVVMTQTTSKPTSVASFAMPIEIKLKSASGDTIVKVDNRYPWQGYQFIWSNDMTGLEVDPNNHVLNKTGQIVRDATAHIAAALPDESEISHNPADSQWNIKRLTKGATVRLTSVDGRLLWSGVADADPMSVPAKELPSGIYMLIITKDNISKNYKLAK